MVPEIRNFGHLWGCLVSDAKNELFKENSYTPKVKAKIGYPEVRDTVVVRQLGWYLPKNFTIFLDGNYVDNILNRIKNKHYDIVDVAEKLWWIAVHETRHFQQNLMGLYLHSQVHVKRAIETDAIFIADRTKMPKHVRSYLEKFLYGLKDSS